jgi:hypothetical protein
MVIWGEEFNEVAGMFWIDHWKGEMQRLSFYAFSLRVYYFVYNIFFT